MRRFVTAIIVAITAAAGLVAVQLAGPPSAGATPPCVQIYRIQYNSPGPDTRSNASLNAELISLYNNCRTAIPLTSWTIKDAANHTFRFGPYSLGGFRTVRVHTGRGAPTATDRYWNQLNYIWNNDKDTASLYYPSGGLDDRCSYANPYASQKYC